MPQGELFAQGLTSIGADFVAELQAEMIRVLPTRGDREKSAFARLGVDEQAWRFMNWLSRAVHPHPREMNKACGFDDLRAVRDNKQSVEALLAGLALGDDVNGHLSGQIKDGYCLHSPDHKAGPDFDLLLNEWGIHHLHLDQASGTGGTRVRSSELLYVILRRGEAFALTVAPHGAWANKQLVEMAVRSWPSKELFRPLVGIRPRQDWSEYERQELRKGGLATAVSFGEQFWISDVTGGITTALVSYRVSRESHRVLRCLREAALHPEHLRHQLMNVAARNGLNWSDEANIAIRLLSGPDRYCFGFMDEASGATLLI